MGPVGPHPTPTFLAKKDDPSALCAKKEAPLMHSASHKADGCYISRAQCSLTLPLPRHFAPRISPTPPPPCCPTPRPLLPPMPSL